MLLRKVSFFYIPNKSNKSVSEIQLISIFYIFEDSIERT